MKKILLIVPLVVIVAGCLPEPLGNRRNAAFIAHPEWSYEVKQSIKERELVKGMTVEQVELAWDMDLTCEYAGTSDLMHYEGQNCYSAYAQNKLREKKYEYMHWGLLHGTYSFWFKNGKLQDWSWSPTCY